MSKDHGDLNGVAKAEPIMIQAKKRGRFQNATGKRRERWRHLNFASKTRNCDVRLFRRGIQHHLSELEARGIRVDAISVDPPETSRNLRNSGAIPIRFSRNPNAEVIARYDLLHPKAGPDEHDVARPAEFLLDSSGTVRWVNPTESYWIRTRPEHLLQATNALR